MSPTNLPPMGLAIGWILTVLIGLYGLVVLYRMLDGTINLEKLISEPNGDASLSRFQFLIFTFVIAMSLFFVIANQEAIEFPYIPPGIFTLLGISGGSYVVSKGIQRSRDADPNICEVEMAKAQAERAKAEAEIAKAQNRHNP